MSSVSYPSDFNLVYRYSAVGIVFGGRNLNFVAAIAYRAREAYAHAYNALAGHTPRFSSHTYLSIRVRARTFWVRLHDSAWLQSLHLES